MVVDGAASARADRQRPQPPSAKTERGRRAGKNRRNKAQKNALKPNNAAQKSPRAKKGKRRQQRRRRRRGDYRQERSASPLTHEMLAAQPRGARDDLIGARLYPLVEEAQPELAGKITGMLLELGDVELLRLLGDPRALDGAIEAALRTLARHQQGALTLELLGSQPKRTRDRLIGDRLYRVIEKTRPELAGKITGMLLELGDAELLTLLGDSKALNGKIAEALRVLDVASDKLSAENQSGSKVDEEDSPNAKSDEVKSVSLPVYEGDGTNDRVATAANLKAEASHLASAGRYEEALEKFSEAIVTAEPSAVLYANRAQCLFKLERYFDAIDDCCSALKTNPDSAKSLHTRGKSYYKIRDYREARADLGAAQAIDYDEESARLLKSAVAKIKNEESYAKDVAKKKENTRSQADVEKDLNAALGALKGAGGRELDLGSSDEEDDDGCKTYLKELLKVCDLRYELGQYGTTLWGNYFRCYSVAYCTYRSTGGQDKAVFDIVCKWSLATLELDPLKKEDENLIGVTWGIVKKVPELEGAPVEMEKYVDLLYASMTGKLRTGEQYSVPSAASTPSIDPDVPLTPELLESFSQIEQMQLIYDRLYPNVCECYSRWICHHEEFVDERPSEEMVTRQMFDDAMGDIWLEKKYELLHLLDEEYEVELAVAESLQSMVENMQRSGSYRSSPSIWDQQTSSAQESLAAEMLESLSKDEQMQKIREVLHPFVCQAYNGRSGPTREDVTEELIDMALGNTEELLEMIRDHDKLRQEILGAISIMECNMHFKGSYRTMNSLEKKWCDNT